MTTWRYCITRRQHNDDDVYEIREVYTHEDGTLSWTATPVSPHGETWAEIADDIAKMTRAMNAPVLDLTLDPPGLVALHDLPRKGLRKP